MRTQSKTPGPVVTAPEPQRAAHSFKEFAAIFGKATGWTYRLEYAGKLKVIRGLGAKLVPHSEVDRLLSEATTL
jgi:hypothetical protein